MAKRKQPQTIVKNGKRVPAENRGKNEKAKPPRSAVEVADDKAKEAKKRQKAAIAKKVWAATEASRTTIGKLAALVDTWEEYDQKAEALKDTIGGMKGQVAETKSEIRRLAREAADDKELKALAKLEQDCERWEVKLEDLKEQRAGAREAMKVAMADIRKVIKDGPGLFEPEADAGNASPPPKPAPSPKAPPPSTNGSGTPSAAGFDGSAVEEGKTYTMTTEQGVVVGNGTPHRVTRVMPSGRVIITHADGTHGTEIDAVNYSWKEVQATPPGESKSKPKPSPTSVSAPSPTSADTSSGSSAPAATAAAGDPLEAVPVAEIVGDDADAMTKLEKAKIKTLHDAARCGRTGLIATHGLTPGQAARIVDAMRAVRQKANEHRENMRLVGAATR